jgi:anti-sigma B factor antagonist
MFDVAVSDSERVRTVKLKGEFDLAAMPVAEELIAESLTNGFTGLELDLRGLTFLDSTGIRALVATLKECTQRGMTLTIVPGPEEVQRVFEIAELGDTLPFRR